MCTYMCACLNKYLCVVYLHMYLRRPLAPHPHALQERTSFAAHSDMVYMWVCVCVYVCQQERVREKEWKRGHHLQRTLIWYVCECVCVCVCQWERVRGREDTICSALWYGVCVCVCVCVCVSASESESEREKERTPFAAHSDMVYVYVCVCVCVSERVRERESERESDFPLKNQLCNPFLKKNWVAHLAFQK